MAFSSRSPFSYGSFARVLSRMWKADIGIGPECDSSQEPGRVGDYRGMRWQFYGHLFRVASAYVQMVEIDHSI